jgi:PAS domain-containing protein
VRTDNECSPLTDLSDDAHILYSSDSIVDILGHTPDEVVNRSVWQFFHPEEIPLAKAHHSRGVRLDKAAVLSYCRLKNRQGDWVGCECCFSVVYDVLVCCISIYRHGMQSQSKLLTAFDLHGMLISAN